MRRTAIWAFAIGLGVAGFYTGWFWLATFSGSDAMMDFLGSRIFLWPASFAYLLLIGTQNDSAQAWDLTLVLALLNGVTYLVAAVAVRDLLGAFNSSKVR